MNKWKHFIKKLYLMGIPEELRRRIHSFRYRLYNGCNKTFKYLNIFQKIHFIIILFSDDFERQICIKGGLQNKNKTYFIIRRDNTNTGLFSAFITNIGAIKYAVDRGYIPIVDMCCYPNIYIGRKERINAWEKYFCQEIGIKEAYKGKNLILSDMSCPYDYPNDTMDFFNNSDNKRNFWRDFTKNHIRLQEGVYTDASRCFLDYTKGKKTLGVLIRGTDYVKLRPPQHPVQPDIDQVLSDTEDVFRNDNYKYIFVATEDKSYLNKFYNRFGDICFTNQRKYVDYREGFLNSRILESDIDKLQAGMDYLKTIVMLTLCDGFLASRTSGTVGAVLLSDGWEFESYYDLGRYPEKE